MRIYIITICLLLSIVSCSAQKGIHDIYRDITSKNMNCAEIRGSVCVKNKITNYGKFDELFLYIKKEVDPAELYIWIDCNPAYTECELATGSFSYNYETGMGSGIEWIYIVKKMANNKITIEQTSEIIYD